MAQDPGYIKTYHPIGLITVIQDVAKFGASSSLDVITSGNPIMIAKFEKALRIGYSYFDPSVRTFPAEAANSLELEKAPAMFKTALDYYEDLLGSNSYLAGDILGLYDEVAARPKFEGLWKRVSTRPSCQKVLKDMPRKDFVMRICNFPRAMVRK
ncbi:hypothetical protein CGLO_03606 [Colletotrichum gloeosporioides Cg-14]|uniref:Uncharacterized protein n=1 Tax=Colletotrichum gloeosporioides (strain Cg-14) TaxID=1237896 RepID=T0LXF2_COLGC|nr:hypothetical protein CGLO_03606 [Colletotrichum gloeosporioides Cg-14]